MPATIPTVPEVEQAILEAEGQYTVHGHYYADLASATQQRRWAAERIVRDARRSAQYQNRQAGRVA